MMSVCVAAVMLTVAIAGAAEGRLSPEAIMDLAREGRNREAIDAFEALPEADGPYPLLLLRAVAGSYWREREFESARELYNEILKRRPTLQGLVPGEEPVVPVVAEASEVADDPVVMDTPAKAPGVEAAVAAVEEPDQPVTKLPEQASIADAAPVEEKGGPAMAPVEAVDAIAAVPEPEPDPVGVEAGVLPASADAPAPAVASPMVEVADATPVAVVEAAVVVPDDAADSPARIDVVLEQLRREYLEIEARTRQRETLLQERLKSLQKETEATVAELDALHKVIEGEREARQALDAEHKEREEALASQVAVLEQTVEASHVELEQARAALQVQLERSDEAEAGHSAVREQLEARISELTGAATDMQRQVSVLQAELARERESVEELKQWRLKREETLEREVEAMAAAAIENALREIEALEQENAALEADGRRRQEALLAQIETLSGQATAAETWSRTLLEDLEKEQRLREELQSSEAKRLKELDDARFALRTASSGIVEQLERIHNELVAHKAELRISYEKDREYSDMAPVLNQLEAAAREAAGEVTALRQRLVEQQAGFDAERQQHRAIIVKLTERVSELEGRNTLLEEKLADTLKALAEADARADRMQERVVLLDRVFASPDGAFDPDMVTGVGRVYGSIAAVAETNSPLAIAQFERLPENADVPASLLKTLAGIYRERKDYATARDLYERVLAVQPDDLQAERRLIMTLFDMGRYDEALARLSGVKPEDK